MESTRFPTEAERIATAKQHVGCRVGIRLNRNAPTIFGRFGGINNPPGNFGADYPDALIDFDVLGTWIIPCAFFEIEDDDNPQLVLCNLEPDKSTVRLHKLSFRLIY